TRALCVCVGLSMCGKARSSFLRGRIFCGKPEVHFSGKCSMREWTQAAPHRDDDQPIEQRDDGNECDKQRDHEQLDEHGGLLAGRLGTETRALVGPAWFRAIAWARSAYWAMRLRMGRNARPSGVGVIGGLRWNSGPPSSCSRAEIALVSEGCEMPLRRAARVKLFSSHSARK